jgi:hypothetical protein
MVSFLKPKGFKQEGAKLSPLFLDNLTIYFQSIVAGVEFEYVNGLIMIN